MSNSSNMGFTIHIKPNPAQERGNQFLILVELSSIKVIGVNE